MTSRLDQLIQKRNQINAKIQKFKSEENTKNRKIDTRKKILIGAAILSQVKKGKFNQNMLNEILDQELSERDRDLFRLNFRNEN